MMLEVFFDFLYSLLTRFAVSRLVVYLSLPVGCCLTFSNEAWEYTEAREGVKGFPEKKEKNSAACDSRQ